MRGKLRCRLHGGRATGPKTAEGRKRISATQMVHGRYSAELTELRRVLAEARQAFRDLMRLVL